MIVRDRSFPHPVLAPFRDDVSPNQFTLSVTVSSDADGFYLALSFDYANTSLDELIERGQAVHSVHIECKRNFYRELFSVDSREARITLKATELVGRVEVSGFVTAKAPIEVYQITGSHPDYGDATFSIEAGDVLAAAPTVFFDAYVDYDPLSNISSILTVRRSETDTDGPLRLDTSGDLIVATLAQTDYDRYIELKGDPSLGPLLANQVVVPAVIEAVHEIKGTPEDEIELDMTKRWFRSIVRKLEEFKIDIQQSDASVIEATQALLRLPLRRSLEGLLRLTAIDGEQ
jgi:hypothetical protein